MDKTTKGPGKAKSEPKKGILKSLLGDKKGVRKVTLTGLTVKLANREGNLLAIIEACKQRMREGGKVIFVKPFINDLKDCSYEDSWEVIEKYINLV